MKYVQLGNSDLTVSRICLGCMGFGAPTPGSHTWTLSEEESRGIIRYALEQGINFFDTAMGYSSGTSEEFVGRALRDFAPRDRYVLATKYTPVTQAELEAGVTGAQHIRECLDASLRRLGMDHIDLYIMHMWDYLTPVYDTMRTLYDAVQAGKIRAIGVSNCYAWQIAKANALAEREGFTKIVSVQGHYNLIHREEERDMRPFCLEENIAMTPYRALASGRLSRLPGSGTTKRLAEDAFARLKYDATAEQDNVIIGRVAEIAEQRGVTMTEVALAWLLTKVTAPVCGATKVRHIDGPVGAVDLELTAEEIARLEEPYIPHALAGVMAQRHWQKQAE